MSLVFLSLTVQLHSYMRQVLCPCRHWHRAVRGTAILMPGTLEKPVRGDAVVDLLMDIAVDRIRVDQADVI